MLQGAGNFRAVKPYKARDGRRLRPNSLFRSGELSRLTEADLAVVAALNIRAVCDLRSAAEQAEYVSRWPDGSDHAWLDLPDLENANARPDKMFAMIASGTGQDGALAAMDMLYRRQPRSFAGNLKIVLNALLTGQATPFLVHCHAGKDRTGFMIAMILAALDISRADIVEDYLLTAQYFPVQAETVSIVEWARRSYGFELTHDAVVPLVEVRQAYIETAFAAIDTEWGGVDVYLEQAVGFGVQERRALQDVMLE